MSETRVRKRASYHRWERFAEFLVKQPPIVDTMIYVHGLLDELCAYRSIQCSGWSRESLDQVLADWCTVCEVNSLDAQSTPDCANCKLVGKEKAEVLRG